MAFPAEDVRNEEGSGFYVGSASSDDLLAISDWQQIDDTVEILNYNSTNKPKLFIGRPKFHPPEMIIPLVLVLGTITLLTLIGNLLLIIGIVSQRSLRQSVFNRAILSMSVSGLLVAIFVMPMSLLTEISQVWFLGDTMCAVFVIMDVTFCTASIFHLVAIAIDRYFCATRLHYLQKRRRHINIMLGLSWIGAALLGMLPVLGWRNPKLASSKTGFCLVSGDPSFAIFGTAVAFYIPTIFIIAIYASIYIKVRQRIRKHVAQNAPIKELKMNFLNDTPSQPVHPVKSTQTLYRNRRPSRQTDDMRRSSSCLNLDEKNHAMSQVVRSHENQRLTIENKMKIDVLQEVDSIHETVDLPGSSTPRLRSLSTHESHRINATVSKGQSPLPSPKYKGPFSLREKLKSKKHSKKIRKTTSEQHRRLTIAKALMAMADDMEETQLDDCASRDLIPPAFSVRRLSIIESSKQVKSKVSSHLAKNIRKMSLGRISSGVSFADTDDSRNNNPNRRFRSSVWKQRERKMAAISLSVTLAFTICWLPYFVLELAIPLCRCFDYLPSNPVVRTAVNWLGFSNCLLNPVIFCFSSQEFRMAFRTIVKI